jgi:hypothetical protein
MGQPAVKRPAASFEEIDMFFEGLGEVHETMKRLVRRLRKAGIPYAIMGGMAVNAHGHERLTKDVDVLLTAKGFAVFTRPGNSAGCRSPA